MNANELADELEKFEAYNGDVFFGTCAVMRRIQQAEIEALKRGKTAILNCNKGNEDGRKLLSS